MIVDTNTILYILGAIVLVIVAAAIYQEVRLRRLLRGKNAATLEDTMLELMKEIEALKTARRDIESYLKIAEKRLRRAISGVGMIRFNPFKGTSGSNQSFSAAFLSEEGNGVVLSSIYSRERVSVFAKPVKERSSEYELTEEEKEAIAKTSNGR
ncbi:MAG: DUF4446 family protein [Patescibacteria group bacterium]